MAKAKVQEPAVEAAETPCKVNMRALRGCYAFHSRGPDVGNVDCAGVGYLFFGRAGKFSGSWTASYGGFVHFSILTGTFSLKSNGYGTIQFTANQGGNLSNHELDFVMADEGRELYLVNVRQGTIQTWIAKKV